MDTRQGPAESERQIAERATEADARPYLLERVGEAAIVQLYADGFSELPLREKLLVWHLAQAAIAGRDIYFDQRYAHNLEMRELLEALVPEWPRMPEDVREPIARYTKLSCMARACRRVPASRSMRCCRASGRCSSTNPFTGP